MNSKIVKGIAAGMAASVMLSAFCLTSYAADEGENSATGNVVFKTFVGDNFETETNTVFVGENVKTALFVSGFEKLYAMENSIGWNPQNITMLTVGENGEYTEFGGCNIGEVTSEIKEVNYINKDMASAKYTYGFGINKDFARNTTLDGTKNKLQLLRGWGDKLPVVDPKEGKLLLAWIFDPENGSFVNETEYLSCIFNATQAGKLDFGFVDDDTFEKSVKATYYVPAADPGIIDIHVENLKTQILDEPETPTTVLWNGNVATWKSAENRGFFVQLYKDGEQCGDKIELAADVESYDFSSKINAQKGDATYTYTVVAKGGSNNSDEITSNENVVVRKLNKPDVPVWDGSKLTWSTVVENAQTYSVQLYKDGAKFGDLIDVDANSKQVELINSISEPGTYTASIIAKADGYNDSEESEQTESAFSTGSDIVGTFSILDGLNDDANRLKFAIPSDMTISICDGDDELFRAVIDKATNKFTFKNVPAGDYKLKIDGNWILGRTYSLKLSGNKSYQIQNTLEIVYGDVKRDGRIDIEDITLIKNQLNSDSGSMYHFIADDSSTVTVSEFAHMCRFYNYSYGNSQNTIELK